MAAAKGVELNGQPLVSRVRSSPINPTDTLQAVRNAKRACTARLQHCNDSNWFHGASGLYPFFPHQPCLQRMVAVLLDKVNELMTRFTSTITAILHRSGLLYTAKRKRKMTPSSSPRAQSLRPRIRFGVWASKDTFVAGTDNAAILSQSLTVIAVILRAPRPFQRWISRILMPYVKRPCVSLVCLTEYGPTTVAPFATRAGPIYRNAVSGQLPDCRPTGNW